MALRRTRTENLALTMLARGGIAAIWALHLAAARAYRDGNKGMAATILEIADAAEASGCGALSHCRANWPDRSHR